MVTNQFSRSLALAVVLLQMLGSAVIWAMDQPDVEVGRTTGAVVAGLSGGELAATSPQGTKAVQFNDRVAFGDTLQTTDGTTAELLINKQAIVTMLGESEISLENVDGNTVVHLNQGTVFVSAAASALGESESVIVETPATEVTMRGGMLRATVGIAARQVNVMPLPRASHAHLASLSSARSVARETGGNERVEVYEGSAQMASRTAGATPLVIESGQSVQIVEGIAGSPMALDRSATKTDVILLAASQHGSTPASGVQLVSQRQMDQVSALQQALYGTSDVEIEGKEKERGAIIATLFGTDPNQQSSSNNPNNPTASLFGSGSPYLAALLAAINRSGAGVVNDSTQTDGSLSVIDIRNLNQLLEIPITIDGGLGLLTITSRSPGNGLTPIQSAFGGSELLNINGGNLNDAPHGGRAPISTFLAQGLTDTAAVKPPPIIVPMNDAARATADPIGTRLLANSQALEVPPYELTIVSIEPLVFDSATGQKIVGSGTGRPFISQVDTTIDVVNLQSRVTQRQTVSTSFDFDIGSDGSKLTKLRTFVPLPEGFATIVLSGAGEELTAGQKFGFSNSSSVPAKTLDGNRGVALTARPAGTEFENFPDPTIVIISGKQDTRQAAPGRGLNSVLDTEAPPQAGLSTADFILSDFSSRAAGEVCSFCEFSATGRKNPTTGLRSFEASSMPSDQRASFIDATISARSSSAAGLPIFDAANPDNDRTVELTGGVVLTEKASFTVRGEAIRRDYTYREDAIGRVVGPQGLSALPPEASSTSTYFQRPGTVSEFGGSVAAIVANDNNPAFVRIQDRVLAVLDGSSITPDRVNGQELRTSLLSVLDSQLIGPTAPSRTDGKLHRETPDPKGEISPLLEIVDSSVRSTSAVVVRSTGILDRALLEASSPILTLANSQMTATGHLIDLAGRGPSRTNLLNATLVPGDALVRLDRGTLNVNGNLLNLANGSATVNGYLFSLANGSTLNVTNGTLLSLTGNSVFRLNSDAFGAFDISANKLNVSNALCAGGECGLLTDHFSTPFQSSNGKPIQVSGSKSNVQLPQGFTPFRAPTGTASTVVVDEHTALLHIEPGSELHINDGHVIRR
jgi:hypothetical protein